MQLPTGPMVIFRKFSLCCEVYRVHKFRGWLGVLEMDFSSRESVEISSLTCDVTLG